MLSLLRIPLSIISLLSLSACSVIMAANGSGISPEKLSACKTRSCMIANGAIPIDHTMKDGHRASEEFRATMPTGSATRAAMHGLLDVSTLGIWEVAGTPIEAVKGQEKGYVISVKYANDGKTVKKASMEF